MGTPKKWVLWFGGLPTASAGQGVVVVQLVRSGATSGPVLCGPPMRWGVTYVQTSPREEPRWTAGG